MIPVLQALVLADHIYVDQLTGNKVIAGTFNHLWAGQFPGKFGRPVWAYICLTDLQGTVNLQLRYVDLETDQVLLETRPIPVSSENPLASTEFIVQVPPFPMPHAGIYAFELYADDDRIGALRLAVSQRKEKTQS